ncbi:MAG TPA: T9SS type A sorting domain-containing protein, partial [Bacteroidales bacterium]
TVMNVAGNSETETKPNYISVLETPAQTDLPLGDDQLCTGMTYEYSINTVPFAETYEWELIPASAGTLVGSGTEIELEASDTWTGDFTLRVRATNMCGDGAWSDDLNGSVNLTPNTFDLIGGGEICEGDPGVEIELMGSETGINYELYNNGVPTGNIISGTGEGISFGLFTEEGNYTAYGSSASCSINMTGEVAIIVSLLPEQLTLPTGTTEVCNDDENEYTTTGAQGSDNVIWSLDPENAGELSSDGMTALIIWNNTFEGSASLTVMAENSCGSGPDSDALEIMVYATPSPDVSGDDLVCKEEVTVYSTTENAGNTYGWEVIGGTVTAGEGTSEITVTWGNTPGQGYVIVNESLEFGCSAVDSLGVIIDDCTGVNDNIQDNKLKIIPNPVIGNTIEINKGIIGIARVQIFNASGNLAGEYEIDGSRMQIDITQLPKGIYLVILVDEQNNLSTVKFIRN